MALLPRELDRVAQAAAEPALELEEAGRLGLERLRDDGLRDSALLDEDLPQQAAALLLLDKGTRDVLVVDVPVLDEELAEGPTALTTRPSCLAALDPDCGA